MTELEIRLLMTEQASLIIMCTQIWLGITTAFVVAAFVAGPDIEAKLRKLVIFLYLIFSLSPIVSWLVAYSELRQLGILLESGTASYQIPQSIFLLGRTFVVLQIIGFIAGTLGALGYFHSTRSRSDP